MNYTHSNYNHRIKSSRDSIDGFDREEILREVLDEDFIENALDGNFDGDYSKSDPLFANKYPVMVKYMKQMVKDEKTKIGSYEYTRSELRRYIFSVGCTELADFLMYIQRISYNLEVKNPAAYYKTAWINFIQENMMGFYDWGDDVRDCLIRQTYLDKCFLIE